ncbi:MAG: ExbD/TolR family protein [Planctomycetota bacterium]
MSKRSRPDTEVGIDMTPMIDMVFLLIIFFIIVNDLTQKDLEELKLPIAVQAGHDDPPPGRPILNVLDDGTIIWRKKKLFYPGFDSQGHSDPIRKGRPDNYWYLGQTMANQFVRFMKTKMDENLGEELPDDPILIRADRNTPFKYIQRIMEVCTREGIRIWKVQLAASEPQKKET